LITSYDLWPSNREGHIRCHPRRPNVADIFCIQWEVNLNWQNWSKPYYLKLKQTSTKCVGERESWPDSRRALPCPWTSRAVHEYSSPVSWCRCAAPQCPSATAEPAASPLWSTVSATIENISCFRDTQPVVGNYVLHIVDCWPYHPCHRRSRLSLRAFAVARHTVWNSLPEQRFRDPDRIKSTFWWSLKTFFFDEN